MTVRDLKAGMVLILRSGRMALVFDNVEVNHECKRGMLYGEGGFDELMFDRDFNWKGIIGSENDIMRVYVLDTPYFFNRLDDHDIWKHLTCVWNRNSKKLTYEEVKNILGYDFEIVDAE